MSILIGGVGYTLLRDMSFGPILIEKLSRLRRDELPVPQGEIEIEDVSYSPIAVVHKFIDHKYDKVVFIAAVKRGREPGTIVNYRPEETLPDELEIRNRINEAVTGTISLDNLLVTCRFNKALPEDVVVIEVEPQDDTWGLEFSPVVEQAVDKVIEMVKAEITVFSQGRPAEYGKKQ